MSLQVKSGGVRRLVFTNKTASKSIDNHHVVRGPGMRNASVRRAIQRRATNNSNGKPCSANNQICPDPCFNYKRIKRLTPLEWLYGSWVEAFADIIIGGNVLLGQNYNIDNIGNPRICVQDTGCSVGSGVLVFNGPIQIYNNNDVQTLKGSTLYPFVGSDLQQYTGTIGIIVSSPIPDCESPYTYGEILSDSNGLLGDYFVWNLPNQEKRIWMRTKPGLNKHTLQNFANSIASSI